MGFRRGTKNVDMIFISLLLKKKWYFSSMDPGLSLDIASWTPNLPDHREQKFVCVGRTAFLVRACTCVFLPLDHASRYGSVFRKDFWSTG